MDTRYVFQPSLAPAHLFTIRYKKKVKKNLKIAVGCSQPKQYSLQDFL